ncbi:MAG TPA: nucleotidyl transferase AbiEii/AbiGii toxin family protein [Mycobacteriales bacterium]|nr:nucleotidyl transferase AbiEii/AbiGii toxin family protein [Mycobacteriales bacterium]
MTRSPPAPGRYLTSQALRAALDSRLMNEVRSRNIDVGRLRRQVAFERLLVRLAAADGSDTWVVKGGLALELRLSAQARATRDLDLATLESMDDGAATWDRLAAAVTRDPQADGFEFTIGAPRPLTADRGGRPGWRFPVDARLGGATFVKVRIEVVARADEIDGGIENLTFRSVLAFAGLPTTITIRAVDLAQHAAEKLHALTREYGERQNTRVKDLVDLVLLIEQDLIESDRLTDRLRAVFAVRGTHPLPLELPQLPASWQRDYAALVADLDVGARTADRGRALVAQLWAECVAEGGWAG